VPSRVELPLARALLGDLAVLAEAEQHNVLELDPQAIRFRHELARRAVEGPFRSACGCSSTPGC
jgi:hypothetical protein